MREKRVYMRRFTPARGLYTAVHMEWKR